MTIRPLIGVAAIWKVKPRPSRLGQAAPGIEGKAGGFLSAQNEAPKQFEAYKEDAISALASFEPGKTLAASTAANDFDFGVLKTAPHTVYLIAPSEKLEAVAPWVSLVLNHAIEAIAGTRGPLRTTFLLDEFPQLPPAPAIMKALRLYRGKGIQLWFYAQGRFSLEGRWSTPAHHYAIGGARRTRLYGPEGPLGRAFGDGEAGEDHAAPSGRSDRR